MPSGTAMAVVVTMKTNVINPIIVGTFIVDEAADIPAAQAVGLTRFDAILLNGCTFVLVFKKILYGKYLSKSIEASYR